MIRVTAPADLEPFEIAQALVPEQILKAEYVRDSKTWHSHHVMRDLHLHAIRAYEMIYARMVSAIRAWIEQHVTHGSLEKAERPFSVGDFVLVSPAQLKEIKKIIGDYHEAFIAGMIDPRLLHHGELARLIDLGILPEDLAYVLQPKPGELPPTAQRMIATAYQYGKAQAAAPIGAAEKLRAQSFQTFAWSGHELPLTQAEREALAFGEEHAAEYVRGLSHRVQADLTSTITDVISTLTHEDVTEAVDRSLRQRTAWRTIVSDLGDQSGDWSRDLARIAATEKQRAMQEGQAREMVKRHGSAETISVAKIPSPSACPHCVRLHLTAGQGSAPIIFKLSELISHGSNVGKKARDWLATVQPVHPFCHLGAAEVVTAHGTRKLALIREGDSVLTHKGRFRPVKRIAQRAYQGDLVEIRAFNLILKVTPEHPYLTQRGWVAASDLKTGDYLMRVHELLFTDMSTQDSPAERLEVFRLADVLCQHSIGAVPSGVYLHGSEQIIYRKVDIEWAYRELRQRLKAGVHQLLRDVQLVWSRVALALASLRRSDLLNDWARLALECGMSSVYLTPTLLRIQALPPCLGVAAGTSDEHVMLAQNFVYDVRRVPVVSADRGSGFSCEVTEANVYSRERSPLSQGEASPAQSAMYGVDTNSEFCADCGSVVAFTDRSLQSAAVDFKHDAAYYGARVEAIQKVPYSGTVYALSVEEDESYSADGVYVHNCACALIRVPEGWGFDEFGNLVPESLTRSELLVRNLRKAQVWYEKPASMSASVPDEGVAIRVADPATRAIVDAVVAATPQAVFRRGRGVTLITTDTDRETTPLKSNDLAYWSGNEIRLMQTLPLKKVRRVLEHEIGHSLNVWLWEKFDRDIDRVYAWHRELWELSAVEGYVSNYARREPIENAAECSRLYLYARDFLRNNFPRTFGFVHRAYADALCP